MQVSLHVTKSKWFSPRVQNPRTKPMLYLHWNQVKIDRPHWDQVDFDHHQNQANFRAHSIKTSNFRPVHKNKVNFDPRTKNMSIWVLTLKQSQFLSPTQNEFSFDPNTEVVSFSILTLKTSQSAVAPNTKIKIISIQTLNHVIFDSHTKPSQFWSLHWDQVNSDPHTEITSISTTHTTKSISMPTLKPCHFRAVLLCVLYVPVHVLVIQQQYVQYSYGYQLVLLLTFPYCR